MSAPAPSGEAWTLITGASDGIGAAFARIAAMRGRNVILSARNESRLEILAAELRGAHGVGAVAIPADLAAPGAAAALWREATAGRRVDFLVNNAGFGRNGPFGGGRPADGGWAREEASIAVNVTALTELMSLAVPHLRRAPPGRILNVASTAAFMPGPGMAVYHATKAYVVSLSRAVRSELAGSGVTITALCPGPTATSFFASADMETARVLSIFKPQSAETVARLGYDAAMRGRALVTPGVMNRASGWGAKLTPASLSAFIAKHVMAKT